MTTPYYNLFDTQTNNGRVLAVDISGRELNANELTAEEANARRRWNETRTRLADAYDSSTAARIHNRSKEDFLCERVVPPPLAVSGQTTRSHGGEDRRPKYPRELYCWQDLRGHVASYQGDRTANTVAPRLGKIFLNSFNFFVGARGEVEEEVYLQSYVFGILATVGIIPSLEVTPRTPAQGYTDFRIADTERVRIVVESKATHSLPLPMVATEVVRRFNNGRNDRVLPDNKAQAERARDKLYVTDTIGQLLRYMLLNGCRYGALTSGTRTYFVCIRDDTAGNMAENVFISDAWFVGEENYLRAWAYIYTLTASDDAFFPRASDKPVTSWADTDGSFVDEDGNGAGRGAGEIAIQHVHLQDIHFEGALGYGRNGCVMRATWNGKQVAVKQFDCAREGVPDRFLKEVRAYDMLKKAQGIYVPEAYFVSELPGFDIKYLGLQLGRDPTPQDTGFNRWEAYCILKDEYGMKHEDFVRRNGGVIITDCNGKERLVLIDWEEYEICHPTVARNTTAPPTRTRPVA